MSTEYTEEELADLSDEEREALLDDEEEVVEEDEQTEDPEDEPAEEAVEEEPAEDELEEQVEDSTEEPEDKPEKVDRPEPQISVRLPEEVSEAFKDRLKDLNRQFDEGEIEMSELLDERDKINREIYNAETEQAEQTRAAKNWKDAQDNFMEKNSFYLEDENQSRYDTLNMFVKVVAASDKFNSYEAILGEARRLEEVANGEAPKAEEKKPEKKPKSPRPTAPNISDIPAASPNEVDAGGEFAHIDRLKGDAYEAALAAMTPVQRTRYLKA